MRSSHQKTISLFMLFTFIVMSFGAYGFNSKWLAHEVDHAHQSPGLLAEDAHAPLLEAQSTPNPEPMSDAEHKQLHAYCHAEPFVNSVFSSCGEPSVRVAPSRPALLTLRLSALESPFRPPRNTPPLL